MPDRSTATLSASLEDYLEAIFQIIREKQAARAKDISDRLKVSRSSVTGALHSLAERELVNYTPYGVITLTSKGQSVATDVVRRHETLRDFFVKVLAIPEPEADAAACKMEHAISESILERFVEFVEFAERCPRGGTKWVEGFGYYCGDDVDGANCVKCVAMGGDFQQEMKTKSTGKKRMSNPDQESTPSSKVEAETEASKAMFLGSLKPGAKAAIVKIQGTGGIRRRLLDMGVTAGTLVEVERVAPMGDPIELKIKGYHLTLRKEEANRIQVKGL